jgi:hypothetical protein
MMPAMAEIMLLASPATPPLLPEGVPCADINLHLSLSLSLMCTYNRQRGLAGDRTQQRQIGEGALGSSGL